MHETKNPDELAELIRMSYKPALSGTVAIDGRDGAGKTSLGIVLQKRLGGTLVSLDDFLVENRGGYFPNLKTGELEAMLATAIRPIIIEGVCMLSGLERVVHEHNILIYVKRLVGGYYWVDEEMCDPAEPVEKLISRHAEEARSFAQLGAELSGELLPENETWAGPIARGNHPLSCAIPAVAPCRDHFSHKSLNGLFDGRGSSLPPRTPTQRLNIFLFKEGTTLAQMLRDNVDDLSVASIAVGLDFEGEIITKASSPNSPRWLQFVQSGTEQSLGVLLNQSASCLIALSVQDRVFAVAFGFARHWIDETRIVRRFGMIVTLNVVHPDRIRSVDREEFETIQRKTRSQTSVHSSMENFGLNVQRDLVRSVTGQPEDQTFAHHVTGADNLIISAPLTFDGLGRKCAAALDHYGRETYRARYGWIDNFTRVTDPALIKELDAALIETLRTGALENLFLTSPDTVDVQEHRGFRSLSKAPNGTTSGFADRRFTGTRRCRRDNVGRFGPVENPAIHYRR